MLCGGVMLIVLPCCVTLLHESRCVTNVVFWVAVLCYKCRVTLLYVVFLCWCAMLCDHNALPYSVAVLQCCVAVICCHSLCCLFLWPYCVPVLCFCFVLPYRCVTMSSYHIVLLFRVTFLFCFLPYCVCLVLLCRHVVLFLRVAVSRGGVVGAALSVTESVQSC